MIQRTVVTIYLIPTMRNMHEVIYLMLIKLIVSADLWTKMTGCKNHWKSPNFCHHFYVIYCPIEGKGGRQGQSSFAPKCMGIRNPFCVKSRWNFLFCHGWSFPPFQTGKKWIVAMVSFLIICIKITAFLFILVVTQTIVKNV